MPSDPNELVAIRHPKNPGFIKTVTRRAFASRERNGWVEAKSPEAKALVEQASPEGSAATTNPS